MSYFGAVHRAVSSAVEHCFHTAGVTGSIPVPPTTYRQYIQTVTLLFSRIKKTVGANWSKTAFVPFARRKRDAPLKCGKELQSREIPQSLSATMPFITDVHEQSMEGVS